MTTQTFTDTLVVEHCCSCGVAFGLSRETYDRRREDHKNFYCTAGHSQHYIGKSETEKLREQLAAEAQRRVRAEARETSARDQGQAALRSVAAYRGQVTRIRNLIARGVCPVAGCRRNFDNVRQHMAAEHPEFHKHSLEGYVSLDCRDDNCSACDTCGHDCHGTVAERSGS